MGKTVRVFSKPNYPPFAPITVEQYHKMLETGILKDGDPIELLDGMLVYKDRSARGENFMTIGNRHRQAVLLVYKLDRKLEPYACHMQTQSPVSIPPRHEPEPDGAIIRGGIRDYGQHPGPQDLSCVLEVADSSLDYDRTEKLAKYAEAGIPQYIIINLIDSLLEVFEEPVCVESRYAGQKTFRTGEKVALLLPNGERLDVPVADFLP